MKQISFKQTESALFNLDSMRTKLLNEQYEQPEREDELQNRIDEIENLLDDSIKEDYDSLSDVIHDLAKLFKK